MIGLVALDQVLRRLPGRMVHVAFESSIGSDRFDDNAANPASFRLPPYVMYGQKIGVDHTAAERLPDEFTPVFAEANLLQGQRVRAEHNGTPILLVRRGQQIYALAETCSHLGGPLSEGKLDGDIIQCPWHASRFSLRDGHVVDGPAVHPQPCLEARVRDSQIEVRKVNCRIATAYPAQTESRPQRRTGTTG